MSFKANSKTLCLNLLFVDLDEELPIVDCASSSFNKGLIEDVVGDLLEIFAMLRDVYPTFLARVRTFGEACFSLSITGEAATSTLRLAQRGNQPLSVVCFFGGEGSPPFFILTPQHPIHDDTNSFGAQLPICPPLASASPSASVEPPAYLQPLLALIPGGRSVAADHPPLKNRLYSIDKSSALSNNRLMKSNIRFTNELIRIVNGALRLDVDKVRNYTAFLAEKLEGAGETSTATRLRKMLDETDHQLRPADVRLSKVLPVDAESRFPLVENIRYKAVNDPPMCLPQSQWDVVHEFLSIAKTYSSIDTNELSGALSFLMYGPPGTGKSRLARHIAQELGLELYVARLDGLISSFLGSTAKNIRALFDFAAKTPCVLFLDEFDAIAKIRSDSQELGELKRVVNSFLQNLDTLGRQSIVLAATNHETLLDTAVWRRFTYRLALQLPSIDQRAQMWTDFSTPTFLSEKDLTVLANLSEGFSGSDIRETCIRLRRRSVANNRPIKLHDAFTVLQNLSLAGDDSRCFAVKLNNKELPDVIRILRERDQRLYSFSILADLLGISKATVHRLAHLEGDEHGE